jgi:uncharacterized protein (DUF362 family)
MRRRSFLTLPPLAAGAAAAPAQADLPQYRVQSAYAPWVHPGMPGAFRGRVAAVHAPASIDAATETVDVPTVQEMMRRGMLALTGEQDLRAAWRRFISPGDVVGLKVNCSGAPGICSHPVIVAETVRQLIATGVKPANIWIYERFRDQMDAVGYDKYVPAGVHILAASALRDTLNGYDPKTYVEVDFFGEEDTRSNVIRQVAETFTKIINIPNMKDHGASGVTGCLKNIAYGNFHNVARSHRFAKTHTYSFIGTLAMVEPVRSRTVLHLMDGLKGVWHGGPFSPNRDYRFYPAKMMFGTDPVAMDRMLLDVIEEQRQRQGAVSVWNRSPEHLIPAGQRRTGPNWNRFVREPGHIEYAASLGLGEYDKNKIDFRPLTL